MTPEQQTHVLKCWPVYFQAVLDGTKTAELRLNDRDYRAGDFLRLREWAPESESYTGRYFEVTVTHVLEGSPGLASGYVVLSFKAPRVATLEREHGELRRALCGEVEERLAFGGDASSAEVLARIPDRSCPRPVSEVLKAHGLTPHPSMDEVDRITGKRLGPDNGTGEV